MFRTHGPPVLETSLTSGTAIPAKRHKSISIPNLWGTARGAGFSAHQGAYGPKWAGSCAACKTQQFLLHVELDRSSLRECVCCTSSRSQGRSSTEWLTWIPLPAYPGNIFYLDSQGSRISMDCLETSITQRALPRNSLGQQKNLRRWSPSHRSTTGICKIFLPRNEEVHCLLLWSRGWRLEDGSGSQVWNESTCSFHGVVDYSRKTQSEISLLSLLKQRILFSSSCWETSCSNFFLEKIISGDKIQIELN